MATEKLAKSHLIGRLNIPPKKTHLALVSFLRVFVSSPDLRGRFKFGDSHQGFQAHIRKLLPLAQQIEDLAPTGHDVERVNAEYPWLNGARQVTCPADYPYPEFPLHELLRLSAFIDNYLSATS